MEKIAIKGPITLVTVTKDCVYFIDEVSKELEEKLRQLAQPEGRADWVSDTVMGLFKRERDKAQIRVLHASSVETFIDGLNFSIVNSYRELEKKGLEKAFRIIGWQPSDVGNVDPVALACSAVATWIQAYAGLEGAAIVADASKIRPRPATDKPDPICDRIREAVASLRRVHPDWEVVETGMVRLNPRSNEPTSCAGVYIQFEHETKVVLWQADRRRMARGKVNDSENAG